MFDDLNNLDFPLSPLRYLPEDELPLDAIDNLPLDELPLEDIITDVYNNGDIFDQLGMTSPSCPPSPHQPSLTPQPSPQPSAPPLLQPPLSLQVLPLAQVDTVVSSGVSTHWKGVIGERVSFSYECFPPRTVEWECPECGKCMKSSSGARKHVTNRHAEVQKQLYGVINDAFRKSYGYCTATAKCPGWISRTGKVAHIHMCERFRRACKEVVN
jgi:hypothetical protein